MILRIGYVSHAILLVINNFFEVKKGNSQKFYEARNRVNGARQAAPKTFLMPLYSILSELSERTERTGHNLLAILES